MTTEEKIAETKVLVNDARVTSEVISTYITLAENRLLSKMYPYLSDLSSKTLPSKHDHDVCELASRMIFRRGFEGQTSSSENGVSRGFSSVDDEDILSRVTQVAGVVV